MSNFGCLLYENCSDNVSLATPIANRGEWSDEINGPIDRRTHRPAIRDTTVESYVRHVARMHHRIRASLSLSCGSLGFVGLYCLVVRLSLVMMVRLGRVRPPRGRDNITSTQTRGNRTYVGKNGIERGV